MSVKRFLIGLIVLLVGMAGQVDAYSILPSDWSIAYGTSWDNPSVNVEQVLLGLDNEFGNTELSLVNGYNAGIDTWGGVENWFGIGAFSVILEELAGYKEQTSFGWYDIANPNESNGQIFLGADGPGASAEISFDNPTSFGFYIDPNGNTQDRMYTQHELNYMNTTQVAIFKILNTDNQYILGWEDLHLSGNSDGDYQDMIVRMTINPVQVPEPAITLFLGLGFVGIAGATRRKLFHRQN